MIEFKSPSVDDVALMKEFANVVDAALAHLAKPEVSNVAQIVASKLQEALMWFSHGVLNRQPEEESSVAEPELKIVSDSEKEAVVEVSDKAALAG